MGPILGRDRGPAPLRRPRGAAHASALA